MMFSFEAEVTGSVSYKGVDGSYVTFVDPVHAFCDQKILVPGVLPLHKKMIIVVDEATGNLPAGFYDPTYDPLAHDATAAPDYVAPSGCETGAEGVPLMEAKNYILAGAMGVPLEEAENEILAGGMGIPLQES